MRAHLGGALLIFVGLGGGTFEEWIRVQTEIVEKNPADLEQIRMLCALLIGAGRHEEAAKRSEVLPKEDPLRATIRFHNAAIKGNVPVLRELLRDCIAAQPAPLKISRIELCRKISGFRRFVPYGEPRFQPGSHVLLYAEFEGMRLKPWGDGHLLHLRYDWELYDDRGRRLSIPSWEKVPPEEKEDRLELRGPVQEYHQSFLLPLPRNLPGGTYTIRLHVWDDTSSRTASSDVRFEVVFE